MSLTNCGFLYLINRLRVVTRVFGSLCREFRLRVCSTNSDERVRLIRNSGLVRAIRRFQDGLLKRVLLGSTTDVLLVLFISERSITTSSTYVRACTSTRFLRLSNTNIKNRSSSNIARIGRTTISVDRSSFVRCLRRGVRRLNIYLLCLVRRGSTMELTTCLLYRLSAFVVTGMS